MKTVAALLVMAILAFGADLKVETKSSSIGFEATELFFVGVEGSFRDFGGTIRVEGDKITAITGEVAVISLNTGIARRDDHLLSSDFFDEVRYKSIFFRSTKVTDDSVKAELTIKNITKKITFKMEKIEAGASGVKIKLTGVVDRTAFDIDNNFMSAIIKNNISVKATLTAK
ncbi:MAG: YceI family protein [Thiovulaceae bacterium]|nr:YceI family protein [Sulfurimonadaceae bacterium]